MYLDHKISVLRRVGAQDTGGDRFPCDHTVKVSVGEGGLTMGRKCTPPRTAGDGRSGRE